MADKEMKWLKRGCLGCLGIVGLVVVVLAVLVLLPLMIQRHRQPEPVRRELTRELPAPPAAPAPPDAPAAPSSVELPPEAPPTSRALRLDLDLSMGSFQIEPGPAGEPLKVEARYDASAFELTERWDASSNTYRVHFGAHGLLRFIGRKVDQNTEVRVIIPRGQPVELTGEIGVGQSRVELGGLWLTDIDLELGAGEHRLAISEPLAVPVPRLRVDASVGETEIRDIGNASPEEVKVHQGVGEMRIDLRGSWQRDARVSLDLGIGECRVRLPEEVKVEIERSSVGLGEATLRGLDRREPAPEGAPTLTLRLSGGIGELRVDS